MQQDLAGVHRLKDGHLKDSTDSTAIELKFPIGLKICVSIIYLCIYIMYIYISLSLSLKYIYISLCPRVSIHMRLDLEHLRSWR